MSILLQRTLTVAFRNLVALQFLETTVDIVAILAFVKDGVEFEVNRVSWH